MWPLWPTTPCAPAGTIEDVTPLQRALSGLDLRELPLVLALVFGLVLDSLHGDEGNLSVAAIPAVALITVPLLWRLSAPRIALVLSVAGVFLCLVTLKPFDVVALPVMVAAYSVATVTDRLRSLLLAGFVVLAAVLGVVVSAGDGAGLGDALLNCTLLLLAVVTGDAVRARRAYRESVLAREAEQAREQRAEALRLVAEERLRISQEVHDVVAHAMVGINVQAGMAAHVLDRQPELARSALEMIKATSGAALTDLRATLGLLREPDAAAPVVPTERLSEIVDLAEPLRAAGVEVEVAINGLQERVPSSVGAIAYRIVQEASTNILRHAGARRAAITVEVGRDTLDVCVEDDGASLVPVSGPVEAGSGNGVRGMAERARSLGGHLDVGRQADGHWRVHAVLPLG